MALQTPEHERSGDTPEPPQWSMVYETLEDLYVNPTKKLDIEMFEARFPNERKGLQFDEETVRTKNTTYKADTAESYIRKWQAYTRRLRTCQEPITENEWVKRAVRALTPDMRVFIWGHQDFKTRWSEWDKKWLVDMIKEYMSSNRNSQKAELRKLRARVNKVEGQESAEVNAVQAGGNRPPGKGGGGSNRYMRNPNQIPYYKYPDADFQKYRTGTFKIVDEKPVAGMDLIADGKRACFDCQMIGHLKDQCPHVSTQGCKVRLVTRFDEKMTFAKKHPPKQLMTTVHQVDMHEDTMSVASGASSEYSEHSRRSYSGGTDALDEHKAEIAAIRAEYQRELETMRIDMAHMAASTGIDSIGLSEGTRRHCAMVRPRYVVVNTNGTSAGLLAEPDSRGIVRLWDTGCGVEGVCSLKHAQQCIAKGTATEITAPTKNLQVDSATGDDMKYVGNMVETVQYDHVHNGRKISSQVQIEHSVCENYHGRPIEGEPLGDKLGLIMGWDEGIITVKRPTRGSRFNIRYLRKARSGPSSAPPNVRSHHINVEDVLEQGWDGDFPADYEEEKEDERPAGELVKTEHVHMADGTVMEDVLFERVDESTISFNPPPCGWDTPVEPAAPTPSQVPAQYKQQEPAPAAPVTFKKKKGHDRSFTTTWYRPCLQC